MPENSKTTVYYLWHQVVVLLDFSEIFWSWIRAWLHGEFQPGLKFRSPHRAEILLRLHGQFQHGRKTLISVRKFTEVRKHNRYACSRSFFSLGWKNDSDYMDFSARAQLRPWLNPSPCNRQLGFQRICFRSRSEISARDESHHVIGPWEPLEPLKKLICGDYILHKNIQVLLSIFNLLVTEQKGRTGEYWPEVVVVRTTEGQYSPVRLEEARLVSCLLYGFLAFGDACFSPYIKSRTFQIFRIIKLAWRALLHPSLKFRKNFNLLSFFW